MPHTLMAIKATQELEPVWLPQCLCGTHPRLWLKGDFVGSGKHGNPVCSYSFFALRSSLLALRADTEAA